MHEWQHVDSGTQFTNYNQLYSTKKAQSMQILQKHSNIKKKNKKDSEQCVGEIKGDGRKTTNVF